MKAATYSLLLAQSAVVSSSSIDPTVQLFEWSWSDISEECGKCSIDSL